MHNTVESSKLTIKINMKKEYSKSEAIKFGMDEGIDIKGDEWKKDLYVAINELRYLVETHVDKHLKKLIDSMSNMREIEVKLKEISFKPPQKLITSITGGLKEHLDKRHDEPIDAGTGEELDKFLTEFKIKSYESQKKSIKETVKEPFNDMLSSPPHNYVSEDEFKNALQEIYKQIKGLPFLLETENIQKTKSALREIINQLSSRIKINNAKVDQKRIKEIIKSLQYELPEQLRNFLQGKQGKQGNQGKKGKKGNQGKKGKKGNQGKQQQGNKNKKKNRNRNKGGGVSEKHLGGSNSQSQSKRRTLKKSRIPNKTIKKTYYQSNSNKRTRKKQLGKKMSQLK